MEAISLGRRVLARNYGDEPEPYDDPEERRRRVEEHCRRVVKEMRCIEAGDDPALVKEAAPLFVTLPEVGRVVLPSKETKAKARRRRRTTEPLWEQVEDRLGA